MSTQKQTAPSSLQDRLLVLCKHPQFIWFLGHVLLLFNVLRYYLAVVTFSASRHTLSYRLAIFGSLITYGIVLFKTYSNPKVRGQINLQLAARIWADENMQYFVLSIYWFISTPIAVALLPYSIFSVFHFLTYMKSNVVPTIDTTATSPESKTIGAKFVKISADWTKANHEKAMRLVSTIEVIVLGGRVLLGVISFGYIFGSTPLTTLLVVASFLRYRYATSAFTRQTFTHLGLQIDHVLADQRVPPAVLGAWRSLRGILQAYAGQAQPVRKAQ